MDNNGLDLEFILQSCGIGMDVDEEVLIENLVNLSDNYTDEELVQIYNYFMRTIYNQVREMQLLQERETIQEQ